MERIGVQRAKRMLLTGDLITGKQAVEWYDGAGARSTSRRALMRRSPPLGARSPAPGRRGLCLESAPAHLLDIAFENLLERWVRRTPPVCARARQPVC